MLAVLRRRNFAMLWLGQLVSQIGDMVLIIALPFYVYQLTGSLLQTGLMYIVETLPRILLGSPSGPDSAAASWPAKAIWRPPI